MTRILDYVHKGVLALAGTWLVIVTLVVAFQIIGRYVPFIPRALWTEEIARMGLLWLVFLGAAATIRSSEHFMINLIPERFSDRMLRILLSIGLFAVGAVAVGLFLGSLDFVQTGAGRRSTTLGTSMVFSYTAPLVSSVLMVVFTIEVWIKTMRDPRGEGLASREVEAVQESVEAVESHSVLDNGSAAAGNGDEEAQR